MDTDRNLLFGVLALQGDLLDNDQFAEACAAWAARKYTPLADLVVARGWLTSQDKADVERLLQRKLTRHGGDARASLAAVADRQVRTALAALPDSDVAQSLARLEQHDVVSRLSTVDTLPETRGRYVLTQLHAQGGLGRVWLARDQSLGRDVALKELRPEGADRPTLWARFLEEAQVTGQLEHPGIVPVYELARRPDDGQPFYAMRFVRGHTLSAAIKAYHEKRQAGTATPLDLRGLLNAFVAVCNAVAYAHSRGVIHRDLKPANVVLGDFGEAMVLDWGLAKVLSRGTAEGAVPPVALVTEEARQETVQGQVLGTPAYMAPEQAEGRSDLLDARTDVYGLGALLYEILAGQPPFSGADVPDVLRRVREEAPVPPRQVVAETPRPLEAVCLKALAKQRADRYPVAKEVADEVQHFLADEPVAAYPEPRHLRLRRWARRHRPLVVGAAAAAAVAVVALTAATGLLAAANRRERGERDKARANFRLAVDAVDKYYTQVSENAELKEHGLEKLRTRLLETAATFYEQFVQDEGSDRALHGDQAAAYWRLGQLYQETGRPKEAEAAFRQGLALREHLAAGSEDPDAQSHVAEMHRRLGWLYANTGRATEAEPQLQTAITLLESLVAYHPAAPAYQEYLGQSYNDLGFLCQEAGRLAEAQAAYEKALALRERLAREHRDVLRYQEDLATSHSNLGSLFWDKGQLDQAGAAWQAALTIRVELARQQPTNTAYQQALASNHYSLGFFYRDTQQPAEAEKHWRAALPVEERVAREHPAVPEHQLVVAETYNQLGGLYNDLKRFDESVAMHRRAADLLEKLVAEYPAFPKFAVELGGVYCNLGHCLLNKGDERQASEWYDRAQQTLEGVLQRDPQNATAQEYLFRYCAGRTNRLNELKRHAEAVAVWDQALQRDRGTYRDKYRRGRAQTLALAGDHARATAEANELAQTPNLSGPALCTLAYAYALSAAAVGKDAVLDAAERGRRAEQYAARAVQLLTKAWDAGALTNPKDLTDDDYLAALRMRVDFKKLLAEMEAQAKPKDKK
jgi:serine/threonine-protein kinase